MDRFIGAVGVPFTEMRMFKSLLAGAFLVTAIPAAAADPSTDASEKVVCKRIKETTGWRLSTSTKVCKKKSEWDAENRDAQRNLRRDSRGEQ